MDSKLRCVFELPSENDKVVSGKQTASYSSYCELYILYKEVAVPSVEM